MAARPISPKPFGRYTLVARLASGGMGTVFLAKDAADELVAIKRIHEHLTEENKFVRMFADEASIAARIHHPNVCPVVDFGEVEGIPYLAMPYLMGKPMNRVLERIRERGLVDERVPSLFAKVIADACEGLHAAHELKDEKGRALQVVHRDVTPHNLFVGYDGVLRVLDFGVASARHRLASTATGEVKGKFGYMAPEHIDGVGADRRADIWSLGVVLWEAIAGEKLFVGETMATTVKAVLSGAVPSLSDYRMDVPLGIEEVVFRALARDREARFPTAHQMSQELHLALDEIDREVDVRDVALFMNELFPEGRAEQAALLDEVRARRPRRADDTPILSDDDKKTSVYESIPGMVGEDPPRVGWVGKGDARSDAITVSRNVPQAHSRRPFYVAGALLGLLVLVLAFSLGEDPEPVAATPPPPSFATPEPPDDPELPSEVQAPDLTFALDDEQPPPEIIGEVVVETPMETESVSDGMEPDTMEPRAMVTMMAVRPRPRGRGTVRVATPGGWAIVYAGNRRLGEAPGSFSLPAGLQRIDVQPFGRGERIRRRVRVRPGTTSRLSVPVR